MCEALLLRYVTTYTYSRSPIIRTLTIVDAAFPAPTIPNVSLCDAKVVIILQSGTMALKGDYHDAEVAVPAQGTSITNEKSLTDMTSVRLLV